MPKPLIAVDIDDVLFPFLSALVKHYNRAEGTRHRPEHFQDYEFHQVWGCEEAGAVMRVEEFLNLDHSHVLPLDGARETLQRLRVRYRLAAVTSRPEEIRGQTQAWIDAQLPGLLPSLHMTGNHYSGLPYRSKGEVCAGLGAAVIVDDQPRHITSCAEAGIPGILFGDYGWNRGHELLPGTRRASDWPSLARLLLGA